MPPSVKSETATKKRVGTAGGFGYYARKHQLARYGIIMVDQTSIKNFMWESIKETFETMISLPIERTDEEEEDKLDPSVSLICTITFTGPLQGVFGVQCCAKDAEKIAKAMLMAGPDDPISEAEICDALGEVTNILIGGIKGKMSEAVGNIQISIPSVTKGLEMRPAISIAFAIFSASFIQHCTPKTPCSGPVKVIVQI